MISATSPNEHHLPARLRTMAPPLRGGPCDESSSFLRQLAVLPEMLATLDTVTAAGQHHIMGKVRAFIENQAGRTCRGLSAPDQRMFLEQLGHLTRESQRVLPDVHAFIHRTESLVSLLATIA